jgi:hypothetical protein
MTCTVISVVECLQVLVTAASNSAVDNLAERLMKAENLQVLRVCKLERLDEKVSLYVILW